MFNIKDMLKYSISKIKVTHSLPGRVRIKLPYLNKVPLENRNHDELISRAIKILNGVETININYSLGTVLVTYNTSLLYEKKLLSWIETVIRICIDNLNLIKKYGDNNLQYVINTIEHQLRDAVKQYS